MPSMPNRRNTETDEVSVIARDRACVRTEQYRHSEVMRSFGHSHIQRCVRAAVAQAMYDPCYYFVTAPIPFLNHDRSLPWLNAPMNQHERGSNHSCGQRRSIESELETFGRRTSQGIMYTDTARTNPEGSTRGRGHGSRLPSC